MSYIRLTEQQILKYYYDHLSKIDNTLSFISEQGKAIYNALLKIAEQDNKIEIYLIYKYSILQCPALKESELEFFNYCKYEEENIDQYKTDLKKVVVQEKIQTDILDQLTVAVSKKQLDIEEVNDIYDKLGKEIDQLYPLQEIEKVWMEPDEYDECKTILDDRLKGKVYSSGCSHLDKYLNNGSQYPGEISIVLGYTGSGKTTFKNSLVEKKRLQRIPVIDINLEMSETATIDSKMALRMKQPKELFYLRDEDLREDNYNFILADIEKRYPRAKRNNTYISYNTNQLNLYKLRNRIIKFKRMMELKRDDYVCVCIDLLTMMDDFNKGTSKNKADWYETGMNGLHRISKELNVHIMGVVQQGRPTNLPKIQEPDDVEIFRPTAESIKNANAIAERARCVIAIFRKKHFVLEYLPNDPELDIMDDIMECQIVKQNLGGISGIFKYLFRPETGELYKYEDESDIE